MKDRIKKVLEKLETDALLVSDHNNVFYLSGFKSFIPKEREAFLFLTQKGNFIFTSSLYTETVNKNIKDFKLIEIDRHNVFSKKIEEIVKNLKIQKLSADLSDLSVSEYVKIRKIAKVVDDNNIVEIVRENKDEKEIENLRKASKLGDEVFKYILSEIKTGITEIEIAKKIEIFVLNQNSELSFDSVVAFGSNSSSPHHVPTNKKLTKNTIILLDFGVKVNRYCSDMTRTVYFGKANTRFKKIYLTVKNSKEKAFEYVKSNSNKQKPISAKAVDKVAREYIIKQGFESIPHSLGHGIGIEVHESPRLSPNSKDELKMGMVFSIEPGIYIPGYGGVRIEDLVLLTDKEPVLISNARSEIIEL